MKKGAKPGIVRFLLLLTVCFAVVLGNVGLRFKYEDLMRKKVDLSKKIKDERTKKVNLTAMYQQFSSEDRIVAIAQSNLGMMRRIQPKVIIEVDQNLIKKVEEALKSKYE